MITEHNRKAKLVGTMPCSMSGYSKTRILIPKFGACSLEKLCTILFYTTCYINEIKPVMHECVTS